MDRSPYLPLVALAALTACSHASAGIPPATGTAILPLQAARGASPAERRHGKRHLYISDAQHNFVVAYLEGGKRIYRIEDGIDYPQGLFVDANANLYVANRGAANVLEFRRGATTPFATFNDANNQPEDVTICPSGTVYVANILTASGGAGSISVYANGSHDPTGALTYGGGNFFFLACDAAGNLFATLVHGSTGTVVEFPQAQQTGAKMLPISYGGNPGGIVVDPAQNLLLPFGEGVEEFTEAGEPTGFKLATVGFSQITLNGVGSDLFGASGNAGVLYGYPSGTHERVFAAGGSATGVAIEPGLN